jgi:hypothetical protein
VLSSFVQSSILVRNSSLTHSILSIPSEAKDNSRAATTVIAKDSTEKPSYKISTLKGKGTEGKG